MVCCIIIRFDFAYLKFEMADVRRNRESMHLATPLSISEPQLATQTYIRDGNVGDFEPNGYEGYVEATKIDERRNSDSGLNNLPKFHDKKKIGHRRVDEEGNVTFKKVPASKLMQSIQEGIRHSVSKLASEPKRDVLFTDFESTEIVFHPKEGTKYTPAHNLDDFHFKTYAPIAFRHFREAFQISPEDYMMSLCTEPLIEISNPGASGSIFYISEDEMYIMKTVEHNEAEFLLKLLPQYYMNIVQNPRTFLPKYFGLYCYKAFGKNVRIVVMDNLLPRRIKYHHKFDLKGSTYKRCASDHEKEKHVPTLKDLDFAEIYPEGIYLQNDTYLQLMSLFKRDCLVLQSFKIMDYSLLLGIHNLDQNVAERKNSDNSLDSPQDELASQRLGRTRSVNRDRLAALPRALDSSPDEDPTGIPLTRQYSTHSEYNAEIERVLAQAGIDPDVTGGAIFARTIKGERLLLFLGIIDILQHWRFRKKLEHAIKSIFHDGKAISVCHPTDYAARYQDFMANKVFHPMMNPSKLKFADIPMRLSGPLSDIRPGSVSLLNKRDSLTRISPMPSAVLPVTFVRSTDKTTTRTFLQPDIVASTAGGTDASSSVGVPSLSTSRNASPLGHTRLRLTSSIGKGQNPSAHWVVEQPVSADGIVISLSDLQDEVFSKDPLVRMGSPVSTTSATRMRLEPSFRGTLERTKKQADGFNDGDVFVVAQISEATQTATNAPIATMEPDYEETDL